MERDGGDGPLVYTPRGGWLSTRHGGGGWTGNVAEFTNPFVATRTAQRYQRGRPYHHRRTLERILGAVSVRRGRAIDVAAGTGLSSLAVADLGFEPVGVEPVAAMVQLARDATGLPYVRGAAEMLPIADQVASLVTVSSAVHWLDQPRFFSEARRVLGRQGLLVLYEHAGIHLIDDERFSAWARTDYVERYPTPPRGTMAGVTGERAGLQTCFSDTWIDTVAFGHDQLVDYLMTQSNVVAAIDSGRETEAAVRSWLSGETVRHFSTGSERAFGFYVFAEALRTT